MAAPDWFSMTTVANLQAAVSNPSAALKRVGTSAAVGLAALYFVKRQIIDPYRRKQAEAARKKEEEIAGDAVLKTLKGDGMGASKQKVRVDAVFVARLRRLLAIVLPGIRSKEFALLALHTCFLVSRTLLSIYVSRLDGTIVQAIVDRNGRQFAWELCQWIGVALPATYINSMIRYLEQKVSIQFRTRLVRHVYKVTPPAAASPLAPAHSRSRQMYMSDDTYYKVGNLDGRLTNPDQVLTQDVSNFCSHLSHLWSHLSKPALDVVLMSYQLFVAMPARSGAEKSNVPLILGTVVVAGTGMLLQYATPPFGKLVAEEARSEGALRAVHSRLITHSEEIAFFGGHKIEESVLNKAYTALVKHMNNHFRVRIGYTMLEQFLMKYVWSAAGLCIIAIPALQAKRAAAAAAAAGTTAVVAAAPAADTRDSSRTEQFVTSRNLLVNAADAIERILSSWKEVTELAGYTARVDEMLTVFEDVKVGNCIRKKVGSASGDGKDAKRQQRTGVLTPEQQAKADEDDKAKAAAAAAATPKPDEQKADGTGKRDLFKERELTGALANEANLTKRGVTIENPNLIEAINVPITTPAGDVLVESISFSVKPGLHMLISGPNGCGKSSLFRMIGGLWPVTGGQLTRPPRGSVYYVPQKQYLSLGNLREQIIYPDSKADMDAKGLDDNHLLSILDIVHLRHIIIREKGWDSVNDWQSVLSGGERQRIAMARLFYWKPKFAVMDECTSQVSMDVEGKMYLHAKELGITLMSVSHRPSLWQYHTHLLMFDGAGNYKFTELNASARLSLKEEKNKLESTLRDVPATQSRLRELCLLLGESSIYSGAVEPPPTPISIPRGSPVPAGLASPPIGLRTPIGGSSSPS